LPAVAASAASLQRRRSLPAVAASTASVQRWRSLPAVAASTASVQRRRGRFPTGREEVRSPAAVVGVLPGIPFGIGLATAWSGMVAARSRGRREKVAAAQERPAASEAPLITSPDRSERCIRVRWSAALTNDASRLRPQSRRPQAASAPRAAPNGCCPRHANFAAALLPGGREVRPGRPRLTTRAALPRHLHRQYVARLELEAAALAFSLIARS
jgi:hypothetical protein